MDKSGGYGRVLHRPFDRFSKVKNETGNDPLPTLAEFRRLIEMLLTGERRSHFRRWEMELLLDIEETLGKWKGSSKEILSEYRAVVEASWKDETSYPIKLSECLAQQTERKPIQFVSVRRNKRSA